MLMLVLATLSPTQTSAAPPESVAAAKSTPVTTGPVVIHMAKPLEPAASAKRPYRIIVRHLTENPAKEPTVK